MGSCWASEEAVEFKNHDTYIQKKLEQRKTKHGGSGLVKKETVVCSILTINVIFSKICEDFRFISAKEAEFR